MKRFLVMILMIICSICLVSKVNAQGALMEELIESLNSPSTDVVLSDTSSTEAEPMCVNPVVVKVKAMKARDGRGYVVYVGKKQVFWFVKDVGSVSAQQRANIVVAKLNKALNEGVDPASIKPVKSGNYTFLKAGNEKIVTVDPVNARAVGVSVHELAYTWANNTRVALGAKPLRKDYSDVSRGFSGKESRYLGHKSVGMASWYGGQFHGRRSSDGSRFNKEEYTAAHKVYPFGTLVKVTNLKNSKSCVVKITDRGPYVHGRIIDLSKKAAEDIGVSGVAKVKLEVVGQY